MTSTTSGITRESWTLGALRLTASGTREALTTSSWTDQPDTDLYRFVFAAPLALGEDLNTEELESAAAGLVRLPAEGLPDSFWKMPAPRVTFEDAVSASASERDDG